MATQSSPARLSRESTNQSGRDHSLSVPGAPASTTPDPGRPQDRGPGAASPATRRISPCCSAARRLAARHHLPGRQAVMVRDQGTTSTPTTAGSMPPWAWPWPMAARRWPSASRSRSGSSTTPQRCPPPGAHRHARRLLLPRFSHITCNVPIPEWPTALAHGSSRALLLPRHAPPETPTHAALASTFVTELKPSDRCTSIAGIMYGKRSTSPPWGNERGKEWRPNKAKGGIVMEHGLGSIVCRRLLNPPTRRAGTLGGLSVCSQAPVRSVMST